MWEAKSEKLTILVDYFSILQWIIFAHQYLQKKKKKKKREGGKTCHSHEIAQ